MLDGSTLRGGSLTLSAVTLWPKRPVMISCPTGLTCTLPSLLTRSVKVSGPCSQRVRRRLGLVQQQLRLPLLALGQEIVDLALSDNGGLGDVAHSDRSRQRLARIGLELDQRRRDLEALAAGHGRRW